MLKKIAGSIRLKTFFQIIFVSVTIFIFMLIIGNHVMKKEVVEYYVTSAERLADSVAHNLRPAQVRRLRDKVLIKYNGTDDHSQDDLDRYAEILDDIEYRSILMTLEKTRISNKIKYATVIIPDNEEKRIVYLADADAYEILEGVNYRVPGESREMNGGEPVMFGDWPLRVPAYNYYVRGNRNDEIWSAASAIMDENGEPIAYTVVDISADEIRMVSREHLLRVLPFSTLLTLLLALASVLMISGFLVEPVKRISDAADHYVEHRKAGSGEQTTYFSDLNIRTGGDEIERLSDSLEKMEQDLNTYIEDVRVISDQNSRIRTELTLANRIQADALPSVFPPFPKRKDIGLYGIMNPAKEVGGDFYDFLLIDEDHLALVVADVSGKGVPAALFMMIAKTLINNTVRGIKTPGRTLEIVNNMLCENNKMDLFVTCWLGIVELSTGKVTYANAGHEDPLYCRDGEWRYLTSKHGFVLAGVPDVKYRDVEEIMEEGDMLFQYTDGVTDCCNNDGQLFGTGRLLEACRRAVTDSAEDFLHDIGNQLQEFEGTAEQFDDITILCFQYLPKQ